MSLSNVSKMIAGGAAGAVAGPGILLVTIPEGIPVPWWGYVIAGAVNAIWVGFAVYAAPKNKPTI